MIEELKACGWCHAPAFVRQDRVAMYGFGENPKNVSCSNGECVIFKTVWMTADEWNRRAPPAPAEDPRDERSRYECLCGQIVYSDHAPMCCTHRAPAVDPREVCARVVEKLYRTEASYGQLDSEGTARECRRRCAAAIRALPPFAAQQQRPVHAENCMARIKPGTLCDLGCAARQPDVEPGAVEHYRNRVRDLEVRCDNYSRKLDELQRERDGERTRRTALAAAISSYLAVNEDSPDPMPHVGILLDALEADAR